MKSIIKIILLVITISLCWAGNQSAADSAKSDSLKKDSTSVSTKKSNSQNSSDTKYDYFIDKNGDGIDDRLNSNDKKTTKKTTVSKKSSSSSSRKKTSSKSKYESKNVPSKSKHRGK